MIIYLVGNLIEKLNTSLIVLLSSGVGLEVEVISTSNYEVSKEIKLYIYSHTKEDGTILYGFDDVISRDVFKILLSVSGVGAKLAMKMLRELGLGRLISAIQLEQDEVLSSVSGVGKKTAARLMIELKGKLDSFSHEKATESVWQVYDAMGALGFSKIEIEKRIEKIKNKEKYTMEELLKLVLQR